MKLYKHLLLPVVITALPFNAIAETVYESINKSGVTEFSDERTPDAEKINVQPNVVDVNIPDIPLSTPKKPRKPTVRYTGTGTHSEQSESIELGRGTAAAGNLKRKIRNHTNGEGISRPAARPAARSGGHR